MALMWINGNQHAALKHFDDLAAKGNPVMFLGGIPSHQSQAAVIRKGLVQRTDGFYRLTALGLKALDSFPDPVEVPDGNHP